MRTRYSNLDRSDCVREARTIVEQCQYEHMSIVEFRACREQGDNEGARLAIEDIRRHRQDQINAAEEIHHRVEMAIRWGTEEQTGSDYMKTVTAAGTTATTTTTTGAGN